MPLEGCAHNFVRTSLLFSATFRLSRHLVLIGHHFDFIKTKPYTSLKKMHQETAKKEFLVHFFILK